MNLDTDTQYAFTRPIAGHMFTNYDGVLKVDGEVGNKKTYDPRSYLKTALVLHGDGGALGDGLAVALLQHGDLQVGRRVGAGDGDGRRAVVGQRDLGEPLGG